MNKFNTGLSILQGIFSLVNFAEAFFANQPKTGEQKKQLVMNGLETAIKTAESVATGGGKSTWEKIEKVAPDLIDNASSLLYPPNK